jgi:hypothetical protein
MDRSHRDEPLAGDLQEVADLLRDQRPTLGPLALDRVKLRAMRGARRSGSSRQKGFLMRSRLTTALTIAFLSLGTGGALAWVGGEHFGFSGDDEGSAACTQYRPGNGFGDKNHCHTGPPGQEGKGGSGPGNSDFGHSHGHGH